MEEKHELATTNDNELANPLARVLNKESDEVTVFARCQICKSQHRQEIEKLFESGVAIINIKETIEKKGSLFAVWQLRHHFDNHYKSLAKQCAIIEYREHLDEMMKRRRNMVDDVLFQIEICWKELSEVLVKSTGDDWEKLEKKQKIIAGLQKTIKEHHEFIKSLHDDESKAKATEERFVKVWQMKLEKAKTEDEKKIIIATLKDFQQTLNQV